MTKMAVQWVSVVAVLLAVSALLDASPVSKVTPPPSSPQRVIQGGAGSRAAGQGQGQRPAQSQASPAGAAVTPEERACLDSLKLLYPGDGRCYQLGTTGPCKSHEWLVLDARTPDRLRPVCARVPCADKEVLWPRDGRCYQRFRDRETLCPHQNNLLVSNPFGLGECACKRSPPHARDPANPAACYPLYHRGPCPDGQLLLPKANATADQGVCGRDPCQQQGHGQQAGAAAALVLWPTSAGGDGRCHPLGSKEVCAGSAAGSAAGSEGEPSFNIDPNTLRPGCINRVYHLLPPTTCSGDKCIPTNTAAYSEGYIKELFQAHKAHKAHRAG